MAISERDQGTGTKPWLYSLLPEWRGYRQSAHSDACKQEQAHVSL